MTKQFVPMLFSHEEEGGNLKETKKRCSHEEKGPYLDYAENHSSHISFCSPLSQGFNEPVALILDSI